jgi:SAM-dependent methyltransferase
MSSYGHYVKDDRFLAEYNEYQKRFASQMPERDKVTLGLIAEKTGGRGSLLDIGCSTGNLLLHISRAFPGMTLTGGELAELSLTEARKNPDLGRVDLQIMDMLDIQGTYDCIVANAVAVYFSWDEYETAMRSVAKALRAGGTYIAFEWLHPYEQQDLEIVEETPSHPEGLKVHFRPYLKTARVLSKVGLENVEFHPFVMPVDLPFQGYEDTNSYTVQMESGQRACFRGALYQPWCHMTATKP